MRMTSGLAAALLLLLSAPIQAQPPTRPGGPRRPGGLVPGQQRPTGDPAVIARGKTIYGVTCTGCHGTDLRGGDMGGPNLLRSQVALSDRDGELIVPIIQGSRKETGMPAIPMSPEDAKAVATYVRSVLATIGTQGMPPAAGKAPETIVVGNAGAGKVYFAAKCAGCHSAAGDLQGLATRFPDPKALQNNWVGGGRGGRGPGPAAAATAPSTTVVVTLPSGESVEGKLARIDDFTVSLTLADDSVRTFDRHGDVPKVEVRDPLKAHRDLLPVYTEKDMHDVTAYLVTLK